MHEELVPIVSGRVNIAQYLRRQVEDQPHKRALILPRGHQKDGAALSQSYTFAQIEELSGNRARALATLGVQRGQRILVAIRPGIDLITVSFALFKLGAAPVFIDPGMGKEGLLNCIRQVRAAAIIGATPAMLLALSRRKDFVGCDLLVSTGRMPLPGVKRLKKVKITAGDHSVADTQASDIAAILFTSGSTGPAKGVVYTHGIFAHQTEMIRKAYGVTPQDVDMSVFPLFALFAICMGMPSVVPCIDFSHPGKVDPEPLVQLMSDYGVSFSFGSPAFWTRVADWCETHDQNLDSVRALVMAGCSVPADLHRRVFAGILPAGADIFVPYGATEALPLCSFKGSEVLRYAAAKSLAGAGTCVGSVVSDKLTVKIIRISDEAQPEWDDSLVLPDGEIGEVVCRGPVVTQEYFESEAANEKSKIRDGRRIWHRMGDLGYLDANGLLWFCGRKNERLETSSGLLCTDSVENIFNFDDDVRRCALVGIGPRGQQRPVLVVQPKDESLLRDPVRLETLRQELLALGAASSGSALVRTILFKDSFPLDVRHNAKIKRDILAKWATEKLAKS